MTLLAPPALPQFPAGLGPQPSDFAGWVTDTLGFQTAGIIFRAEQTVQQAFASGGTSYTLAYDTVLEDPYGGWTGTSPPPGFPDYAWIAPYSGILEVEVFCSLAAATANMQVSVLVSGATAYAATQAEQFSATLGGGSSFLRVPVLGGLDYIQAQATLDTNAMTSDVSSPGRLPDISIQFVSQ